MAPATLTPSTKAAAETRQVYVRLLTWAFAGANVVRVLTYLPTMWAIHGSGHSDQHSLLTWVGCMLANGTMAAWIHEHNGRRIDWAVAVNAINTLMCAALALVIVWYG